MHILLVEDDSTIATELIAAFSRQGWDVDHAPDGAQGLERATARRYSVIVLDRMLPGVDGMTVLKRLRDRDIKTPILILSALGDPVEKVAGLDGGANDYVSKPFSFDEVLARVRALDRHARSDPQEVLREGDLEILLKAQKALYAGKHVALGPAEYRLLRLLVENAGDTVTRRMIMEKVFNWRAESDPAGDRVAVHIRRLREKLQRVTDADVIVTVRGIGYSYRAGVHA
jgi:two-component system OmpR family response regulator